MAHIDAQIMELMLRAPEAPETFKPDFPPFREFTELEINQMPHMPIEYHRWVREQEEQRLIQWAAYYAKKVMEAAQK